MPKPKKDKSIHADTMHAKIHGKDYVKEEGYLHLDKPHKDWYNRSTLGKQLGKPKYSPPKERKPAKNWKNHK